MRYGKELIRLVLAQPSLIEEAQAVLYEANNILLKTLRDYINSQIHNNFTVSEVDNENFNFWRPAWEQSTGKEPFASFWLGCEGEDSSKNWLSVLCGQVRATGYFAFCPDYYGGFGIKKKEWKKYLLKYFNDTPAFSYAGFTLNSSSEAIIIPITLNSTDLAEKYPNLDECFGSVDSALEAITTLLPEFEKIIEAMKNWGSQNT